MKMQLDLNKLLAELKGLKDLKGRDRKVAIAGGAAVLALIVLIISLSRGPSVTYKEFKVARGSIELRVLSTGVVQPENRLEIKPPIPGRVESVLVDEGALVKKGQILAWMSSTERAALLDAARAKGPKEVQRWEKLYRPTPILAPINGTIILRKVDPGQTFSSGDGLLVMSDRLTIKAQVDETDIAQIKLKQKAEILLDAYPGQSIPGHVDQVAFEAKTINNVTTYIVDVLPEKVPDFMRSGMTANVTFQIASKSDVLQLPTEAVKIKNGQASVHRKSGGFSGNEKIQITTGLTDGKNIEILAGLAEGDTVLIEMAHPDAGKKKKKETSPFSPNTSAKKPK